MRDAIPPLMQSADDRRSGTEYIGQTPLVGDLWNSEGIWWPSRPGAVGIGEIGVRCCCVKRPVLAD